MRKQIVATALFLMAGPALADAPFCLVNNSGMAQCFYYSLDACRQAQQSLGGMCSANIQQQQQQQIQPVYQPPPQQRPNFAQSFQEGYERGQRMRLEREQAQREQEEHEMRMQAAAAERDNALRARVEEWDREQPAPPAKVVHYACPTAEGTVQTTEPAIGCVVTAVD
jgi:hypothetical protein